MSAITPEEIFGTNNAADERLPHNFGRGSSSEFYAQAQSLEQKSEEIEHKFIRNIKRWMKMAEEWGKTNETIQNEIKSAELSADYSLKFSAKAAEIIANKYKTFGMPAKTLMVAQAVALTYANALKQLGQPWPMNLFAMAGTISAGMATVNEIKKQKFEYGGPIYGPSHAQGGVVAELEGGEHVWSKQEVAAAGGQRAVEDLRKNIGPGGRYSIHTLRRHQNMTRQADYLGMTG